MTGTFSPLPILFPFRYAAPMRRGMRICGIGWTITLAVIAGLFVVDSQISNLKSEIPAAPTAPASTPATPAPPAISALSTTGVLLSPADRELIAQTGLASGNWLDMAETLRRALLADRNGFATASNPAWSERLYLCQLLYWLGQNECEQAALFVMPRLKADSTLTVEKVREALQQPGSAKNLAKIFIDDEDFPRNAPLAQRLKPEALTAILKSGELVEELAQTVSREDYLPGVVRVLNDLYTHAPNTFGRYPALVAALAVVYDQPLPSNWPNHQVPQKTVPLDFGNWNGLFDYFTSAAESRELLMDIQKLRADQLKFLIDAPLKVSEFQWARKNIRQSRSRFEDVFSLIEYDHSRAGTGQFVWPDTDYTLATISKSGGICVDQAYFAAVCGKARGLPTLYFSGQGKDGGHAWFGYLKTDEKWVMDAGRYGEQKYVTGYAVDPQNWRQINDHELDSITNRVTLSPEYRHSNSLLVLATMSDADGDNDATADLLQSALKTSPNNSAAWMAMASFLRTTKQTELLKQHLQAMASQFEKQPDLRTYALQQQVEIAREAGDTTAVNDLQQQIIQANRLRRSDLSIAAGSDVLTQKLASGDYPAAYTEYKNLIRKFKSDGGGNLYYDIVAPFVRQLHKAGQIKLAKDALSFAYNYLKPSSGSILDGEFEKLQTELNAAPR